MRSLLTGVQKRRSCNEDILIHHWCQMRVHHWHSLYKSGIRSHLLFYRCLDSRLPTLVSWFPYRIRVVGIVLWLQFGIICLIFACETVQWHCFSFFRTHFCTLICDSCLCCWVCRWLAAVISGALVEIINIPLWLCELCCNALGLSGVF